jgi:DUF4097 and DUF4098 domain-containing protein YvlB
VTIERLRVHVRTRSGRIDITAVDGVTLQARGANVEHEADGTVLVTGAKLGSNHVEVQCGTGTDLVIGTLSGHVTVRGTVGDVHVTTRSGRVDIEHAAAIDVRSAAGHITIGDCDGACRVVAKSSRVHVGRAGSVDIAGMSGHVEIGDTPHALVRTMSGRVALGTREAGNVEVRTLSGAVEVVVPADCRPATSLKSRSGRIRCDCQIGTNGAIDVATTSGAISVTCK